MGLAFLKTFIQHNIFAVAVILTICAMLGFFNKSHHGDQLAAKALSLFRISHRIDLSRYGALRTQHNASWRRAVPRSFERYNPRHFVLCHVFRWPIRPSNKLFFVIHVIVLLVFFDIRTSARTAIALISGNASKTGCSSREKATLWKATRIVVIIWLAYSTQ